MENISQIKEQVKKWIKENLVGKQIFHPQLEQIIEFNKRGLKHTLARVYQPFDIKLKAIYQLENLLILSELKNSERDKLNRPEIKQIHTFYSKAIIDDIEFEFWLKVRETNNGTYFYDHGIVK
jgi:hypothetical protein